MNKQRLDKLRQEIEGLRRRGGIKPAELESLAKGLGRIRSKRGKEPNWVSVPFPELYPVSIPHHGSQDLGKFTARAIIDRLELDLERWAEEIEPNKKQNW
jgi:hypothetical protein